MPSSLEYLRGEVEHKENMKKENDKRVMSIERLFTPRVA